MGSKRNFSFEELCKVDDISTFLVIDQYLGFMTHKMDNPKIEFPEINPKNNKNKTIIENLKNKTKPNFDLATKQILNGALGKSLLQLEPRNIKSRIEKHIRNYLNMFHKESGIDIKPCSAYSGDKGKGVMVCATKNLKAINEKTRQNRTIDYLFGEMVEIEKTKLDQMKTFSVMVSKRTKNDILWLGSTSYLNHNCEANCEIIFTDKKAKILIKKDITNGEEITIHYGNHYFDDNNCNCECIICKTYNKSYYWHEEKISTVAKEKFYSFRSNKTQQYDNLATMVLFKDIDTTRDYKWDQLNNGQPISANKVYKTIKKYLKDEFYDYSDLFFYVALMVNAIRDNQMKIDKKICIKFTSAFIDLLWKIIDNEKKTEGLEIPLVNGLPFFLNYIRLKFNLENNNCVITNNVKNNAKDKDILNQLFRFCLKKQFGLLEYKEPVDINFDWLNTDTLIEDVIPLYTYSFDGSMAEEYSTAKDLDHALRYYLNEKLINQRKNTFFHEIALVVNSIRDKRLNLLPGEIIDFSRKLVAVLQAYLNKEQTTGCTIPIVKGLSPLLARLGIEFKIQNNQQYVEVTNIKGELNERFSSIVQLFKRCNGFYCINVEYCEKKGFKEQKFCFNPDKVNDEYEYFCDSINGSQWFSAVKMSQEVYSYYAKFYQFQSSEDEFSLELEAALVANTIRNEKLEIDNEKLDLLYQLLCDLLDNKTRLEFAEIEVPCIYGVGSLRKRIKNVSKKDEQSKQRCIQVLQSSLRNVLNIQHREIETNMDCT